MLNFFLYSLIVYATVWLFGSCIAIADALIDCDRDHPFDWRFDFFEKIGFVACLLLPFLALANAVKFLFVAYTWFF